jgi:hypothetical protein
VIPSAATGVPVLFLAIIVAAVQPALLKKIVTELVLLDWINPQEVDQLTAVQPDVSVYVAVLPLVTVVEPSSVQSKQGRGLSFSPESAEAISGTRNTRRKKQMLDRGNIVGI